MSRWSLRATMLVPLLTTLVVGSVALGTFVFRAVERDSIATVDVELGRILNSLFGSGTPFAPAPERGSLDDPGGGEGTPVEFLLDATGSVRAGAADSEVFTTEQLAMLVEARGLVTIDTEPRHRARVEPGPIGTVIVVALPLDGVDQSLASLRRNLILGGVVLVSVQAAVVLAVARAVSRPVGGISAVAHRIREGELDAVVPAPAGPRETAALTEDLSAMLDRLRNTINERERAAADAERARRDMERFMADASHELRTPLTALRGYSELYQAGMLDDEGLERAMDRIASESGRLGALVVDLLHLVRPTDRTQEQDVDVGAVASAVVEDLRAAHPARSIELVLDGQAAVVWADPARVHQAVLNLGANACQHTPQHATVTVRVRCDGTDVMVDVIDDGPGVDLDNVEALLQPFTRADASRSRQQHDGAGLGLALAHRIAGEQGGALEVAETPGGGATFTVRLRRHD